jgi:hypothetical protein
MKMTRDENPKCWKISGVLGLAALVLSFSAAAGQFSPGNSESAEGVSGSAGVPADWWSHVQQDIAQQEYQVTWQGNSCIEDFGPAWHAPNRAHNLRTYFTENGPRVVHRTESHPAWLWGLELTGYGTEGSLSLRERVGVRGDIPFTLTHITANGNRIEFHRQGGLIEWYVNDPRGLEQGFTIASAPSPLKGEGWGDGEISIDLAIRGNLIPHMLPDGETIEFLSEGGVGVIHYGRLRAWDAKGKDLPARMELLRGTGGSPVGHHHRQDANATIRLVVDDSDAVYPVTIDPLASASTWTAESNEEYVYFGWSVATAGDVNGDGYSDVIIGAPEYDNGETDEGRAYVYHGSASGLSPVPDWTAESNQAAALFGYSVSTAGDVNGDGYDDVIIGAPDYESAYVYHGSASGLAIDPAWTVQGEQETADFGHSVSTAGDVNNDGYSDIVIGANQYDAGSGHEGAAFTYHGSASGLSTAPDWIAAGDQMAGEFGTSVSNAGDTNGDGYDDVIIGEPFWNDFSHALFDLGKVVLFRGSSAGLSATPEWTAEGERDGAEFGWAVSTAGDVNGDGYDDVIVGSYAYIVDLGSHEGRAYVYHGSSAGPSVSPDWITEGTQVYAHFGLSVSTAGDVNGDGYSEVIVGANYFSHWEVNEGCAFVYHGSASGLAATHSWSTESDQDSAFLGTSVSTAGDVNGDGFADVIVGAHMYDNGQEDEGRAYVYHGSASGLPATTPPPATPTPSLTPTLSTAVGSEGWRIYR